MDIAYENILAAGPEMNNRNKRAKLIRKHAENISHISQNTPSPREEKKSTILAKIWAKNIELEVEDMFAQLSYAYSS